MMEQVGKVELRSDDGGRGVKFNFLQFSDDDSCSEVEFLHSNVRNSTLFYGWMMEQVGKVELVLRVATRFPDRSERYRRRLKL